MVIVAFWLRCFVEAIRERLFYSNRAFRKLDRKLRRLYRGDSAYQVARRYWNDYVYGETPISTVAKIADWISLTSSDRWVELGCGRGRSCFWLRATYGCAVVAIDKVPTFIERGKLVGGVEFIEGDFCDFDFSKASVAYLTATCLGIDVMEKVARALEAMPEGSRLVTVSESILDYLPTSSFFLVKRAPAPFSWGEGTLFVHMKVSSLSVR